MKGQILSYRKGKHTQTNNQMVIDFKLGKKDKAKTLIDKKIQWKSQTGKLITGVITSPHGNSGKVRAIFERGLPGQAINTEVEVI